MYVAIVDVKGRLEHVIPEPFSMVAELSVTVAMILELPFASYTKVSGEVQPAIGV
jgi:hypothetical protein